MRLFKMNVVKVFALMLSMAVLTNACKKDEEIEPAQL
jgi:hypothetical protein